MKKMQIEVIINEETKMASINIKNEGLNNSEIVGILEELKLQHWTNYILPSLKYESSPITEEK